MITKLSQRLHIKMSTSLKVSRVAVFVLLGLITVQLSASALLWYAHKVGAATDVQYSRSVAPIKADYAVDSVTDGSGNTYATTLGGTKVQKYNSQGVLVSELNIDGSDIELDGSGNFYTISGCQVKKFTSAASLVWQVGSCGTPSVGNELAFAVGPRGLAVDTSGNVYVTDWQSPAMIRKINSAGQFVQWWSTPNDAYDNPTNATDITIDSQNNLYVSSITPTVFKFDTSGNLITQWGEYGTDPGQITNPYHITTDSGDNVYVLSGNDCKVTRFLATGEYSGTEWYGSGTGSDSCGSANYLSSAGAGNLWIHASSGLYKKVNPAGSYITEIGTKSPGQLDHPQGVALDSANNLYVADTNNNRIQKFDSSGNFVTQWGTSGSDNGQFSGPRDIAIDASDNVYVADSGNYRVQKFTSSGVYTTQWNNGVTGFASSIAVDKASQLVYVVDKLNGMITKYNLAGNEQSSFFISTTTATISDIAIGPTGDIFITNANTNGSTKIQRYTPAGGYVGGVGTYNGPGNTAADSFSGATGIVVDSSGKVYASNTGLNRVQLIDWDTASFTYMWGTAGSGDGQFSGPQDLALDSNGNIYVADTGNNRVQVFSIQTLPDMTISNTSLPDGRVGVAYSQQINVANPIGSVAYSITTGALPAGLSIAGGTGLISGTPTTIGTFSFTVKAQDDQTTATKDLSIVITPARSTTTLAADNATTTGADLHGLTNLPDSLTQRGFEWGETASYGQSINDTTSPIGYTYASQYAAAGSGDGQLNWPGRMATDSSGNVYILDRSNGRIEKYDSAGNFAQTIGTPGSGDGQISNPLGIAVDYAGNIYVSDTANNRIQKFNSSGSFVLKWGSYGSGDGQFNGVQGLATDSSGNVYAVDQINHRIQKFDPSGTYLAQWGSYGSGNGEFAYPNDVAVGSNGVVYVSDTNNYRIQEFDTSGTYQGEWGGVGLADNQFIDQPQAIALAPNGDVVITTNANGGVVKVFDSSGNFLTQWTDSNSFGVAVSLDGQIILANTDSSTASVYSPSISASLASLTCNTTYHYRAFATDSTGTTYGNDDTFTTSACPFAITTTSLPDGQVGDSYLQYIDTAYAVGNVTYSMVDPQDLPDGISLTANGFLEGTPTTQGDYSFTVQATDDNSSTDVQLFSLHINPLASLPINITTASLPDGTLSTPNNFSQYMQYIYTENSVGNGTCSIASGTLPDGISLSTGGDQGNIYCLLDGQPSATGTFNFTVEVQDSRPGGGSDSIDSQAYTVTIDPASSLGISTVYLTNAVAGFSYNSTIYYYNEQDLTTFSLVSGDLPPGISLTLEGYLQGTPTQAGTYNFTVQAEDGFGTATQALTLVVLPTPEEVVNTPFVTITSPSSNTTFVGGASTVTGTGPANQAIQLFVDGKQVGTTIANSLGNWAYQVTGIAAGSHTLDAKWVPGAEVAFVPVADINQMRSTINVVDTASDTVVKQFSLPVGGVATTVMLRPNETTLHVGGVDLLTGQGAIWQVDLNSLEITSYHLGDGYIITSMAYSLNPSRMYIASATGDVIGVDATTQQPIGVVNVPITTTEGAIPTLEISDDGSELYVFKLIGESVIDTNEALLYKVKTSDMTLNGSVALADNSTPNHYEITTSFRVVGGVGYASTITLVLQDNAAFAYQASIKEINLQTGDTIQTHIVSNFGSNDFTAVWYAWIDFYLPGSMYIDSPRHQAYLRSFYYDLQNDKVYARRIKLNLLTDDTTVLDSVDITSLTDNGYLDAALGAFLFRPASPPTSHKLYIPTVSLTSGSASLLVTDLVSGTELSGSKYPVQLGTGIPYMLDDNYINTITPPKDSITFSVDAAPTTSCTTTNTCPKPPTCTDTHSCPVVTQPPPTGVTTPSTGSSISPRIISTPAPVLPATSRLGWFDRNVLAVARFIPTQAAIGFPFLLLVLLLVFALSLYYQSSNEVRKDKLNRDFIAKRTSIRAQQDNFIALASHYLNTPITIIQSGVETMEDGEDSPTK